MFEIFSQRYERGSTAGHRCAVCQVDRDAEGSEHLTGALLDRLTRHVHILELSDASYQMKTSKQLRAANRAK